MDSPRSYLTPSRIFRRIVSRGRDPDAGIGKYGTAGTVAAAIDLCELRPDAPIEREMAGGEAHLYRVSLAAGQYLHVVVDQRGIDVVVTLFGPDGQPLIEMDSPNNAQGPEAVSLIAETSGDYRLEVRSVEKEAATGRYEARIEEVRAPTPLDWTRIAAERAFAEGQKLRQQATAESLRLAIQKYEEARPLWRAVGDRQREAYALSNIGLVYFLLGEPQEALGYLDRAFQLQRAIGDRQGQASTLANLAINYRLLGELQKALNCFSQALLLTRNVADHILEDIVLHNLGSVYTSLGEYQKALDYLGQALQLSRAIKVRNMEAEVLNGLGKVYYALGDIQKALDYLEQALQLRYIEGDRRPEARALHYLGVIYYELGEKPTALDYLEQALRLWRVLGDRRGIARALHSLGTVNASLGENQKALAYYHQALSLWRAVGDRVGEANTVYGLAHLERDSGHLTEARAQLEAALEIIESLRTQLTSQDLRDSFFASSRNYYEFYVGLLMQLHQRHASDGFNAAALQASERARARSLLETLTEAHADIRQGVDPVLLERERQLQQQLNAKAQPQTQRLLGEPAAKQEVEALLTHYREIQAQIRASSPRYAALTQPQPLSVREIQQQVLDEGTLLLEYALGEERSFLWAVTPTGISSFELPKRTEIETTARRVYDLMTARNKRVKFETAKEKQARVTQADAEYPEAAATLSQMLLGPVAAQLGTDRLVIVSEGALQYIPFGALPKPGIRDQGSGISSKTTDNGQRTTDKFRPLILDHEIVSLPSASMLAVLRQEWAEHQPATQTVAVLADPVFDGDDPRVQSRGRDTRTHPLRETWRAIRDRLFPHGLQLSPALTQLPDLVRSIGDVEMADEKLSIPRLPFTRQEAEGIIACTSQRHSLKALDFAASRATVMKGDLGQYRLVHFATHGLLNSQHPELSGIVLSLVDENGQPQDGFLRAHEIYNLNLPVDLVVLSGCKTGLGKEIKGEGVMGLTRGFMYAGAARVLVSLWDVHDAATAELMNRFYQGMLAEGRQPAAALQAAQVAMWKETDWAAPYYWAGFQLQGEWR